MNDGDHIAYIEFADLTGHQGHDNGMEWICDDSCPHPDHTRGSRAAPTERAK